MRFLINFKLDAFSRTFYDDDHQKDLLTLLFYLALSSQVVVSTFTCYYQTQPHSPEFSIRPRPLTSRLK